MRWTEAQLAEHLERTGIRGQPNTADVSKPPFAMPDNFQALGRLKTGEMNQTEAAYAEHLSNLQRALEVLWFKFEGIKLRLADNTFFTPDFVVMNGSYQLECREVKGFMRDDAAVKLKVAAAMYPFRFVLVRKRSKRDGGGWLETEI